MSADKHPADVLADQLLDGTGSLLEAASYLCRIPALEAALKRANDQAERFEREWYLRGDQIEALEAERDAFKRQCYEEMDANHALRQLGGALPDEDMGAFLRRVIAERDALRADAERYRWLRDTPGSFSVFAEACCESMDEDVDAARKAAP